MAAGYTFYEPDNGRNGGWRKTFLQFPRRSGKHGMTEKNFLKDTRRPILKPEIEKLSFQGSD